MTSLIQELRRRRIIPKRALGQHFLVDRTVAQKIVRLASLDPEDIVVEIGPGMGVLTFLMLPQVKKVLAVELDRRLVAYLREKGKKISSLAVVYGDALQFDFRGSAEEAGGKLKVVANLPYNISTPIIFRLLESWDSLAHITVMLQQEVAQRITSPPGSRDYSPLSISAQLYTSPKILMRVPPHAFYPRPAIQSAVVGFEILEHPRVEVGDMPFFQEVVRASFAQRRKTILNSLKNSSLALDSSGQIRGVLESIGIDPRRRAETLDLVEFKRLAEALSQLHKGHDSLFVLERTAQ